MINKTDEQLLAVIIQKENQTAIQDALTELYRRYARLCFHHNFRLVHSGKRSASEAKAVAEDILQQKFLKILQLERFSIQQDAVEARSKAVKNFLFTIDHNDCLNYLKQKRFRIECEETVFEEWERSLFHSGYQSTDNPESSADKQKKLSLIEQACSLLSKSQFIAIYYWIQGYTYKEIAVLTDKSENQVRGHIWHGLSKIREYFDDKREEID